MTSALFAACNLVAGYLPGVDILRGVSLDLAAAEIVGVIGPNGAGKSTLVKAMFGLVDVRGGTVTFQGEDVTGRPAHELVARGIGYVPQSANVFPSLTVEDNLRMGLFLSPKRWAQRFGDVTDMFPLLRQRRRQRAGSLSGGERQLVAMGRALMMDPAVLLLDEPSAGLSPTVVDAVFDQIEAINQAGVSIVMVEQNARRCLEISDHGYVLDQGQNAYSGTGRDLLADPKVIDLYLGTLTRR
jgi:branched-chain amino acid transport system ATP-binding protein